MAHKDLGVKATTAQHLMVPGTQNVINTVAPTPRAAGDQWVDEVSGNFYVAVADAGSVLRWIQQGAAPVGYTGPAGVSGLLNGLAANRPASAPVGTRYSSTDTFTTWEYDGIGWFIVSEPEQSYTPSTTNITLGTGGTVTGRYQRSNGWINWDATVVLGTGGVLTGQPSIGLPVAFGANKRYQGYCILTDASVNNYRGVCESVGAGNTGILPLCIFGSGVTEAANNLSATNPYTWGVSDAIQIGGHHKMNTRYL